MATFRFNFLGSEGDEFTNGSSSAEEDKENSINIDINSTGCYVEHYPDVEKMATTCKQPLTISKQDITLYYTDIKEQDDNLLLFTDNAHSDLMPGIYEGGLKIWECTYDLLDHMEKVDFKGKVVLDLGCGSGLLGIYALMKEAKEVHFQDFNPEVILNYTIPNIFLNTSERCVDTTTRGEGVWSKCRFFSGDWDNFKPSIKNEAHSIKYDIIVTSETIYNPQNHKKLLQIFYKFLKTTGNVYVAAKTHYFGVGGTVSDFIEQINKDKVLFCAEIKNIPSCVQRAILELKLLL